MMMQYIKLDSYILRIEPFEAATIFMNLFRIFQKLTS
jgi:hypothetical protein